MRSSHGSQNCLTVMIFRVPFNREVFLIRGRLSRLLKELFVISAGTNREEVTGRCK
jgi:hypothetical protein